MGITCSSCCASRYESKEGASEEANLIKDFRSKIPSASERSLTSGVSAAQVGAHGQARDMPAGATVAVKQRSFGNEEEWLEAEILYQRPRMVIVKPTQKKTDELFFIDATEPVIFRHFRQETREKASDKTVPVAAAPAASSSSTSSRVAAAPAASSSSTSSPKKGRAAQSSPDLGRFSGMIKSFAHTAGWGLISCPEAQAEYGCDVHVKSSELGTHAVGDMVTFTLFLNSDGKPQAKGLTASGDSSCSDDGGNGWGKAASVSARWAKASLVKRCRRTMKSLLHRKNMKPSKRDRLTLDSMPRDDDGTEPESEPGAVRLPCVSIKDLNTTWTQRKRSCWLDYIKQRSRRRSFLREQDTCCCFGPPLKGKIRKFMHTFTH